MNSTKCVWEVQPRPCSHPGLFKRFTLRSRLTGHLDKCRNLLIRANTGRFRSRNTHGHVEGPDCGETFTLSFNFELYSGKKLNILFMLLLLSLLSLLCLCGCLMSSEWFVASSKQQFKTSELVLKMWKQALLNETGGHFDDCGEIHAR